MDKGITFVDSLESTRKLWTFKLKSLKERREGGVDPLELAVTEFTMDWGLVAVWADVVLTGLVVSRLANALRIRSHCLAMRASS